MLGLASSCNSWTPHRISEEFEPSEQLIYDDLWLFIMTYNDLWLFMMIYDALWFVTIYYDLWWFMMIYDYLWWFMMIYDDLWWFIMKISYGKKPGRKGMAIAISKVFPKKNIPPIHLAVQAISHFSSPGPPQVLQKELVPRRLVQSLVAPHPLGKRSTSPGSPKRLFHNHRHTSSVHWSVWKRRTLAQDSSRSGGLVPNPSFIIMLPIRMAIDWHSMPNVSTNIDKPI